MSYLVVHKTFVFLLILLQVYPRGLYEPEFLKKWWQKDIKMIAYAIPRNGELWLWHNAMLVKRWYIILLG